MIGDAASARAERQACRNLMEAAAACSCCLQSPNSSASAERSARTIDQLSKNNTATRIQLKKTTQQLAIEITLLVVDRMSRFATLSTSCLSYTLAV